MDNRESIRRQRRRAKKRRRMIKAAIRIAFCVLLLAGLIFIIIKVIGILRDDPEKDPPLPPDPAIETSVSEEGSEGPAPELPPQEEEQPEPEPEPETQTVVLTEADIHRGLGILVNASYSYVFPEDESHLVDTYDYKGKSYKFRDNGLLMQKEAAEHLDQMLRDFCETTGKHDVNIISTYRTLQSQQNIYNEKVEYYGSVEKASKWVAYPGTSEHHTGLAVDLGIYTDDGESYDFRGQDEYGWVNANCTDYGFVVRYDSEKTDITGIADEPWHFRYVGAPHAEIMTAYNLCHEEYVAYLKAYPESGKHLLYTTKSGYKYEIFYVPSAGATTEIILPKGAEYSVTGNNVDGYIVTIDK